MLGVVVGQEPGGVDPSEPRLGGDVGLPVLDALVVAAAFGTCHPLPFDLVLYGSLGSIACESAPKGFQHPGQSNGRLRSARSRWIRRGLVA